MENEITEQAVLFTKNANCCGKSPSFNENSFYLFLCIFVVVKSHTKIYNLHIYSVDHFYNYNQFDYNHYCDFFYLQPPPPSCGISS